jgi:hypothetical protein
VTAVTGASKVIQARFNYLVLHLCVGQILSSVEGGDEGVGVGAFHRDVVQLPREKVAGPVEAS